MIELNRKKLLDNLQSEFRLKFNDIMLLNQAFTHKSFANESKKKGIKYKNNERLEFFGDAVLKLVISAYLYQKYPRKSEGELSQMRAYIVSDSNLSKTALSLGLNQYLLLGESEEKNKGRNRRSNTANLIEALIGAVYLDQGLTVSTDFTINILKESLKNIDQQPDSVKDYKSQLQELVQEKGWQLPEYRVIKETGPDHEKEFHIQARAGKGIWKTKSAVGIEKSKKRAEQMAAKKLLLILEGE